MERENKAVLCMLASALSFAIMQFFVKRTSGTVGVWLQVFMRNAVIMLLMLGMARFDLEQFKVTKKKKALFLRCFCGFMGVISYFYATRNLNLSDASALNKTSSFFVILFSLIILKKQIHGENILAMMIAFIGVLFIIKPSFSLEVIPALIGLSSAAFSGLAYLMISYIGEDISSNVIIFYFGAFSCLISLPLAFPDIAGLNLREFLNLFAIGLFAGGGQWFITRAYKLGEPNRISIYSFTSILFSTLLGAIILREHLDPLSAIGIVLILIAAYYNHQYNLRTME